LKSFSQMPLTSKNVPVARTDVRDAAWIRDRAGARPDPQKLVRNRRFRDCESCCAPSKQMGRATEQAYPKATERPWEGGQHSSWTQSSPTLSARTESGRGHALISGETDPTKLAAFGRIGGSRRVAPANCAEALHGPGDGPSSLLLFSTLRLDFADNGGIRVSIRKGCALITRMDHDGGRPDMRPFDPDLLLMTIPAIETCCRRGSSWRMIGPDN